MNDLLQFISAHTLFTTVVAIAAIWALGVIGLSSRPRPTVPVDKVNALLESQKQRLWDHAVHEDVVFNERLNFFLLFESVLLGAVGVLFSRTTTNNQILQIVAILGIVITLFWFYTQARHKYIIDFYRSTLQTGDAFPEYKFGPTAPSNRRWPISVMWLLAYVFPLLTTAVWIGLLALMGGWGPR